MANPTGRSVLVSACGAHLIQDGLVALQFVLLPILAQLFGLSYAQVGILRAVSHAAMSLLEIPSGILAEKSGERRLLAMGLCGAGIGYIAVATASTFYGIVAGFLISGIGAAFQHSLSSSILVKTWDDGNRRRALGTYNSFGDVGKLTYTGLFSAAIGAGFAWHGVVIALSMVSVLFGIAVLWLLRNQEFDHGSRAKTEVHADSNKNLFGDWGIKQPGRFWRLGTIVFLDSIVQAVFLTFLVFILKEKGAGSAVAASGVVIALAGGMVGKFTSGFLAAQLGDQKAFVILQVLTIAGIAGLLVLPVNAVLMLLPLIGLVVQGSSTVTYGSVADYMHTDRQARGYALIYSLSSASSVTGPFVFGLIADYAGLTTSISLLTILLCITIVLAFATIQPARTLAADT